MCGGKSSIYLLRWTSLLHIIQERITQQDVIFLPDSPFRQWWDMAMVLLVVYNGVMVPIRIAFSIDGVGDDLATNIIENFSNTFFIIGKSVEC